MFALFMSVYLVPRVYESEYSKNICRMNEWNVAGSQQEIN